MTQWRIFHLIKSLGQGGAEMLLRDGLSCSDRSCFTFGFGYFLPWKNEMVPSLQALGVDVECFHARNPIEMFAAIPRVAHFLKDWGADLVHCHLPLSGVVGRLAGRLAGIPVIYTEHNLLESYHPGTRWLNLRTWRIQDRVIAVSEDVQRSIYQHAGEKVPVELIRNGIVAASFQNDPSARCKIRQQFGIPADATVVGIVAVQRIDKNLFNWLEAANQIRKSKPGAHFLLVGDGVLRGALEEKAAQIGLNGSVHFAGFQSRVQPFLSAMDVYMISSNFEGLPLALLEAMAMNLSVVATRVGGIPEVVVDGETGYLVNPQSAPALAESVLRLLENSAQRESFGVKGRKRVEEMFDIRFRMGLTEQVYRNILQTHVS